MHTENPKNSSPVCYDTTEDDNKALSKTPSPITKCRPRMSVSKHACESKKCARLHIIHVHAILLELLILLIL